MTATPEPDPWEKLTPEERRRAKRHQTILYVVMAALILLPFVALIWLRR
jgi:hypothetical protein